jgi:energy-coupling factor transporter ATP-binding protein EcfA2
MSANKFKSQSSYSSDDESDNPIIVKKIKTAKSNLPQTQFMEAEVINKFPSLTLIVGKSGSGKSNVLVHMLTKPQFMGEFFDEIFLFSPTAKSDDLVEHLKLADENIIDKLDYTAVETLSNIIDKQDKKIKDRGIKSVAKDSKVLIICDDCISEKVFIKSDILSRLVTAGRHSLISTIILSQSYTKVPRVIRLQSQGLILFPSSNDELDLLNQDICPANTSKKEFLGLIKYATREPYSFIFVNHHVKNPADKFRMNFDKIISI